MVPRCFAGAELSILKVEASADSLAICQAMAGVVGFLSTLAVSPLVSTIQANGNTVFGLSVYAQQVVSVISLLFAVIAVLYVRFAILNRKNKN